MSTNPDYRSLPNYGPRTVRPVGTTYQPWITAAVATVVGVVVSMVLGFVAGLFGVVWVMGGGASEASERSVLTGIVVGYVLIQLVVVVIQSRFVKAAGGSSAFLACFVAAVAAELVGLLAGMAHSTVVSWAVVLVVQVVVIALLSTPKTQR